MLGHYRVKIPFLTFADDTMISAEVNVNSCHSIKNILNSYFLMSEQLVNYHKSASQYSNNTNLQLMP